MIPAVLLSVVLATASADTSTSVVAPTHPPITAIRLDEGIDMDGVLSEAVWQNGHAVTQFTQRSPIEGAQPTERTEVRIAYDEDAVYIGARMYDSSPDSIIRRLGRRDSPPPADEIAVYFDPLRDRRSGYWFVINAAGVLRDGTLYNDSWDESTWDAVWTGRARVDEQGWTAEMRIPFSQMRMQSGNVQTWGVNFRRSITRKSERDLVVYQPSDGSGFVSRFPDLVGIENVSPGGNIEILPYVTSKGEFRGEADPQDPFFTDGNRFNGDIGGDLKMAVGNNLVLNATVNPDFGQVEVDPAVVNLSDVEAFFEERRPFFTEGANTFRFGQQGATNYWGFNWSNPLFFYSRRIGRAPQGDWPDGDYVDVPAGTTILGAAKLTGRAIGMNVGTLHAVTGKEFATHYTNGAEGKTEVEPLTYYGVARGQKEFNDRRQGLGVMGTLAARNFDDPMLKDAINKTGAMAGLDGWTFLDENKVWVVSGWAGLTHVAGNEQRMIDLQRSSRALLPASRCRPRERGLDGDVADGCRRTSVAQQGEGQLLLELGVWRDLAGLRDQRPRLPDALGHHQRSRRCRLQVAEDETAGRSLRSSAAVSSAPATSTTTSPRRACTAGRSSSSSTTTAGTSGAAAVSSATTHVGRVAAP